MFSVPLPIGWHEEQPVYGLLPPPPPEISTGRRSKSPTGCGSQTAMRRARVERTSGLFSQPVGHGGTCFPVRAYSRAPDVFVPVTFQGVWATGFSQCPSVDASLSAEAKQVTFLSGSVTMPFRHTRFPFHMLALCPGARDTQRGLGHTPQHMTGPRGPGLSL